MKKKILFECEISVRLTNILCAADLYTFDDCMKTGSKKMLKYRQFGHKSLKELRQIMAENGYILPE